MKRSLDIAVALTGLIVLAPLLAVLALAIRLVLGRPVLFRQRRPGLNGAPFEMVKFRTMTGAVDEHGTPLPDGQRMSAFGAWLRRCSLDELPELLNVFRGEMSLVGPRPLLMQYLDRYTPEQARRHEVKPGLTGWAQINGRNSLSWQDRFILDVWYVDHRSFALDIRILALTVWKVLRREGISEANQATMTEFLGPAPSDHSNVY